MGNTSNPREQSGKDIATRADQIKRIDDNWYQVKAQSLKKESWYDVIRTRLDSFVTAQTVNGEN